MNFGFMVKKKKKNRKKKKKHPHTQDVTHLQRLTGKQ